MTSLPPPATQQPGDDSLEKKVYGIIEQFKTNIPVMNDRYRLGYSLVKYMQGAGDSPVVAVKSAKIHIEGISANDLAAKLQTELDKIK